MDPIISSIMSWPCDLAPDGWLFCKGQTLSINENNVLFSLIGNTYGGDENNFMLPNLPGITRPELS
jgi:microcystin-dependent protein